MRHGLPASPVVVSGASAGFSLRIRPTVVLPIWILALASLSAIFALPSVGQNNLICSRDVANEVGDDPIV